MPAAACHFAYCFWLYDAGRYAFAIAAMTPPMPTPLLLFRLAFGFRWLCWPIFIHADSPFHFLRFSFHFAASPAADCFRYFITLMPFSFMILFFQFAITASMPFFAILPPPLRCHYDAGLFMPEDDIDAIAAEMPPFYAFD